MTPFHPRHDQKETFNESRFAVFLQKMTHTTAAKCFVIPPLIITLAALVQ
jgi:hypothetical protein